MSGPRPLRGAVPGAAYRAEVPYEAPEPRRVAEYTCLRGHGFGVPLAAGAEPPDVWECRSGQPAGRDQSGALTALAGRRDDLSRRLGLLMMRRSPQDGESILARRLAEIRGTIGA